MEEKIILLVEDNPEDALLTLRALQKNNISNKFVVACDGQEAIDYLFHPGSSDSRTANPLPQVILLDLKLPKLDGFEVLRRLRGNERTRLLPVVILTTSNEEQDRFNGYGQGANSFVRKPVEFDRFTEAVRQLGVYWLLTNEPAPPSGRSRVGIPLRVLFIEDCADDAALQVRLFEQAGYDIVFERVDSPATLNQMLDRSWDLIISDYSMPQYSGTDALRLVRKLGLETPFIFVSGTMGEETAVAALKIGAQDYLMKDNLSRLIPAVQRELREAEERKHRRYLEQQVHQLQRFEAIGRLAGGVAHDFNNVIGAIMGWAEMGSSEAPPESPWRDRFLKIRMQADRAAALTRQLLAFARRQILQPRNMGLNELVREEITLLKNVIGEHNRIEMNLAESLPPICADPSQIEQVIMNLCLNARDAMPHGGRLTITTETTEYRENSQRIHPDACPGPYVLLSVSDTGDGIAGDTLEHIFEPFFTTKDVGKGSGLGLATVYGVVKQHKGFIVVDSEDGCGTTFRIYLPVASGTVQTPPRITQVRLQRGTENILIAEDNDDVRETTQKILQNLGYNVFAARNGVEAIELFRRIQASVDLVLLDVIMPVLNGPDAALEISAIKPDIPFVFTTGYAIESNLRDVSSLKQSAILQKPYDTMQLASKLREVLDREYT